MNNYDKEVAKRFGNTDAYNEYADKTSGYSKEQFEQLNEGLNAILAKFANCKDSGYTPDSDEAQTLVKELQNYITENYYTCTNQIFSGLGQMYVVDDRFRQNIDKHGKGTAEFICKAIELYCK